VGKGKIRREMGREMIVISITKKVGECTREGYGKGKTKRELGRDMLGK